MIVEIEKPRPSCRSTLDYNENKIIEEGASLVAAANVESTDKDYLYDLFQRMERTPYPITSMSFHASVNPSEEDYENCSEEDILSFIDGMMASLGYSEQPYLVYRHNDIERQHYHIVSIRADWSGRKINDYYINRNVMTYMRSVSEKYGFKMAEKGVRKLSLSEKGSLRKTIRFVPPSEKRCPRAGIPVSQQLVDVSQVALGYDFSSFHQFACVLESLGVQAFTLTNAEDDQDIYLRGLDKRGAHVTEAFSESSLNMNLKQLVADRINLNRPRHSMKYRERERTKNIVSYAFAHSKSEGHFKNMLFNKGLTVHFSRRDGSDGVIGVTVVDHLTRTVFKGSELGGVINAVKVNEAVASGRWGKERGGTGNRRKAETEQLNRELRASRVTSVINFLKPAGQQKKTTWGGKSRETLQKEAEDQEKKSRGIPLS